MSESEDRNDIYQVDGHDLSFVKGTDAFRLYGWSGRHNSIQMIEARQDIYFGNRYHKWTEKTYETLEGYVEFCGQHIDEFGEPLGLIFTRNIDKGHTRQVKIGMAHALHLKAGAKLICRINRSWVAAMSDNHEHELIKPELINQELDNEVG